MCLDSPDIDKGCHIMMKKCGQNKVREETRLQRSLVFVPASGP